MFVLRADECFKFTLQVKKLTAAKIFPTNAQNQSKNRPETVIQHCLTFTRGNQDSCIATEALQSEAFGVQVICSSLPLCEVAD